MANRTSINLGDTKEKIENQLGYGDSLSGWVREACELRLAMLNDDEEVPEIDAD